MSSNNRNYRIFNYVPKGLCGIWCLRLEIVVAISNLTKIVSLLSEDRKIFRRVIKVNGIYVVAIPKYVNNYSPLSQEPVLWCKIFDQLKIHTYPTTKPNSNKTKYNFFQMLFLQITKLLWFFLLKGTFWFFMFVVFDTLVFYVNLHFLSSKYIA